MPTHRFSAAGRNVFPWIRFDLVEKWPGGPRNARITLAALVVLIVAIVVGGILRSKRVAEWTSIDVVTSRDPLQELPIRVAGAGEVVPPAHTYDAVLDLKAIRNLVVGVDLDFVPRGAARYDAVIRSGEGRERFRAAIPPKYFEEGRFMLRLFSRKFPAADYTLEIEAAEAGGDSRVVAASWFQVLR